MNTDEKLGRKHTSNAVIGSESNGSRHLYIVAGLVAICLLVVGGWFFVQSKHHPIYAQNPKVARPPSLPAPKNTSADYATFQSDYDTRIAAASSSPAVQAELYNSKAELYISQGDYKDALAAALKANELQPNDLMNNGRIAYIYATLGDSKDAIQYYQNAIGIIKAAGGSSASGNSPLQQYYQNQINQLERKP